SSTILQTNPGQTDHVSFTGYPSTPEYNSILISAIDVLIKYSINLHVLFVPGHENSVVDALSRFQNDRVQVLSPRLQIYKSEPPRDALGVSKK
ncbi:hypothetical protein HYDPIDRAFT_97649, partial [Hydnomerulius pinastri MD-312]